MSMFFCEYHQRQEDSDYLGYNVDEETGHEYCDDAVEIMESENE